MTTVYVLPIDEPPGIVAPIAPIVDALGVPMIGLTQSFDFAETSLSGGFLEAVTGNRYAHVGTGAIALAPGGGVTMDPLRSISTGAMDMAGPWTIAVGVKVDMPTTAAALSVNVLQVGPYHADGSAGGAGFNAFVYAGGSPPASNYPYVAITRAQLDGVLEPSYPATPTPSPAIGGAHALFSITHDGEGGVTVSLRRGGVVARVLKTWAPDAIQGPTGAKSRNQQVLIGAVTGGAGKVTHEYFRQWKRALTENEINVVAAAMAAGAAARGRP